ncbi:MAG TPA: serine/threonine-protein kinase, partial [Gemmatimonadaceae bacterium]|nr:serine/threonine-protein kinase [Gemmatimonadaceae bacterium]
LHSFGEIDKLWYFVMAYVRGESLAERVRREGFLPWLEAHRIFSEMADALECAHRNGVVHRDIKPANILLDSETGRAILADFGISKMPGVAESLTATGSIIGTPDYMSPEQVTGSDVDQRSDIYSLGAVAYVMLTGREPFRADNPGRSIYRRVVEDAIPVETLVPSIPADLSSVVRKCMARDRADRWGDARLLKEALTSIIAVDRLPDAVRDLPSFGPYAFLWAAGWAGLALLTDRSVIERVLLMLVALIVPIGLVLHLWNGAGREMRFLDLARIALWPPEWWGMWWPRALRRPSDLWDRLPWMAKAVRVLLIASVPALLLLMLSRAQIALNAGGQGQSYVDLAELAVFIIGALGVVAGIFWARREGLALDQSLRLLLGPTLASPGWNEPAMRRLLAPESGKVREPDRDSPSDHLRAIRELLPMMPATGRDAGLQSLQTAERVLKAIEARDSELATLSRDAGPQEADRLMAQLDALETDASANTGERAEFRELVRHQLDLVRRMQGRREVVLRERAHFVDLLRGLWKLVRSTGDTLDRDIGAVDRLQALCAEIRLELDGEVPRSSTLVS